MRQTPSGFTRPLARLIDQFERLPGIGPRTAQRLALRTCCGSQKSNPKALRRPFWPPAARWASAKPASTSALNPAVRSATTERSTGMICVVADSRDLRLECTREYSGRYHVLGGLISPMDGIGPEMLQITSLVRRVEQEGVQEVILALTPSVEGDTTSLYLARLLKPFTVVSRIAYGLPVGSELEYADDVTLTRALEGRRAVE